MSRNSDDEKYFNMHPFKIYHGQDGRWYTYFLYPEGQTGQNGEDRYRINRKTKADMDQAIIDHYHAISMDPTFEDAFRRWIEERMTYGELEDSTYTKYCNVYSRFFPADEPFTQIHMRDMNDHEVEVFLKKALAGRNVQRKAFNDLKTVMNGVFKFSRREGYTDYSITLFFKDYTVPARMLAPSAEKDDSEEVFSEEETEKLASYLWQRRTPVCLGLLLMFQTGMRVGETASLRICDVGKDSVTVNGTEVYYRGWKTGQRVCEAKGRGKTEAAHREILIPEQAKITISAALLQNPDGPYLFMKNGHRIKTRAFNYELHKACRMVEIPERSPHKIRKTYASLLVASKVDERLIMHQMGHRDFSTTMKFYAKDRKERKENLSIIRNIVDIGAGIEEKDNSGQ